MPHCIELGNIWYDCSFTCILVLFLTNFVLLCFPLDLQDRKCVSSERIKSVEPSRKQHLKNGKLAGSWLFDWTEPRAELHLCCGEGTLFQLIIDFCKCFACVPSFSFMLKKQKTKPLPAFWPFFLFPYSVPLFPSVWKYKYKNVCTLRSYIVHWFNLAISDLQTLVWCSTQLYPNTTATPWFFEVPAATNYFFSYYCSENVPLKMKAIAIVLYLSCSNYHLWTRSLGWLLLPLLWINISVFTATKWQK